MNAKVKKVSSYQGLQNGVKTMLHTYVILDKESAEQFRADKDATLESGCPVFDGATAESKPYEGQPRFTSANSTLTEINRYATKTNGVLDGGFNWGADNTDQVAIDSEMAQLPAYIQAEIAREAIAEAKQRAKAIATAVRLQRARAVETNLAKK